MNKENIINGLNNISAFIAGRLGFEQAKNFLRTIDDTLALLQEQENCEDCAIAIEDRLPVVRCKDCKWYDERISMCDNCGLPREQTFFCKDGKRKESR